MFSSKVEHYQKNRVFLKDFFSVLGECENDSECRSDQACFNFACKDSCQDACGVSAQCKALNHGTYLSTILKSVVKFFNFVFFQVRSVLVPMDTWVTRLQHAELPEIHPRLSNKDQLTPESLDCPDSSALLITLLVSFKQALNCV